MERLTSRPWLSGAAAVALLGIGLGKGVRTMSENHYSEHETVPPIGVGGIFIFLFVTPWGIALLVNFLQRVHKELQSWLAKAIILGGCFLVFVAVAVICVQFMVKPGKPLGIKSEDADAWTVFAGLVLLFVFVPLLLMTLQLLLRLRRRTQSRRVGADEVLANPLLADDGHEPSTSTADDFKDGLDRIPSDMSDLDYGGTRSDEWATPHRVHTVSERISQSDSAHMLYVVFVFVILFPAIILCTCIFPPIWNVPYKSYYRTLVSPLAAVSSTTHFLTSSTNATVLKLYVDVIVYYAFIYCVCAMALLAKLDRHFMRWLHRPFYLLPRYRRLPTCAGEVFVVLSFIALAAVWFWYWFAEYIDHNTGRISQLETPERLARTFGHMGNLFLSVLAMPISRTSVLLPIFGVPFERAVKYHRWLGWCFFASITCHMFSWWSYWCKKGFFPHDQFSTTPSIVAMPRLPHTDNFLMPVMFATYLVLVVMVGCAYNMVRRKWFERFYFTHHLFMVVFVAALMHAWTLWYFLTGSLVLWVLDRMLRFYRGSTVMEVQRFELTPDHQHTWVQLRPAAGEVTYQSGQYAFLNIPQVSSLQWHPFTIASSPFDSPNISFYIKNMGRDQFTGQVAELASTISDFDRSSLVVSMDGPYGEPFDASVVSGGVLLLICGGVGVTPCHSILRSLVALATSGRKAQLPSDVYFVWSVKMADDLRMLQHTLRHVNSLRSSVRFHLRLHATRQRPPAPSLGSLNIELSRPDLKALFETIDENHPRAAEKRVMSFVCGPPPLVDSVRHLSVRFGWGFHTETFAL